MTSNSAEAACKLAYVCELQGEIELAIAIYQEALLLQPDYHLA